MTPTIKKFYDMEILAKSKGFYVVPENGSFESRVIFSKNGVNIAIVRDYFDEMPNERIMRRIELDYEELHKQSIKRLASS